MLVTDTSVTHETCTFISYPLTEPYLTFLALAVRPTALPCLALRCVSFQTTVADIFKKYPEIEQECNDEVANHEWCTNIK